MQNQSFTVMTPKKRNEKKHKDYAQEYFIEQNKISW